MNPQEPTVSDQQPQIQPQTGVPSSVVNSSLCPQCHTQIPDGVYFCPNCGHKIKNPPPKTTVGAQIGVYLFAVFAPPFGIIPAIRYLKDESPTAKKVGTAILVLTVISFIITSILTVNFFNSLNQTINSQMGSLNGLGY